MKNKLTLAACIFGLMVCCMACKKQQDFLEEKTISKLFIPSTLEDVQSLLDNTAIINDGVQTPDLSADNFYIDTVALKGLSSIDQNTYMWNRDIYGGQGSAKEWNRPYEQVMYANISLAALQKINASTNTYQWNALRGAALFVRAFAHFNVAQLFAVPYDEQTADIDPGIPVKLTADVTEITHRENLRTTYNQVIADLYEAVTLLPLAVDAQHPNRPSKPAACALLSRIYVSMRQYNQAGAWADSCLKLSDKLFDYNTANTATYFPFAASNPEILYQAKVSETNTLMAIISRSTIIDSTLLKLYTANDLRCSLFYMSNPAGKPTIKSSYSGDVLPFTGLAIDEVYLTRAECFARNNNTTAALNMLDTLLKSRYRKGSFNPLITTLSALSALDTILQERRKEMPFRGIRWMDIRRLNKEGAQITLTRLINGIQYKLQPGDLRFVLPIPPDVIALTGIAQNPR